MNCSAAISEIENDRRQDRLTAAANNRASDDWALVKETAQLFLDGKTFHTKRVGGLHKGRFVRSEIMPARFTMDEVSVMVFESDGYPDLLAALVKGEPNAADAIADLTRRSAYEVAFDALDLDSRWDDLQALIAAAEQ